MFNDIFLLHARLCWQSWFQIWGFNNPGYAARNISHPNLNQDCIAKLSRCLVFKAEILTKGVAVSETFRLEKLHIEIKFGINATIHKPL